MKHGTQRWYLTIHQHIWFHHGVQDQQHSRRLHAYMEIDCHHAAKIEAEDDVSLVQ
jgi:hypothetical protein